MEFILNLIYKIFGTTCQNENWQNLAYKTHISANFPLQKICKVFPMQMSLIRKMWKNDAGNVLRVFLLYFLRTSW